jgi:hypothetical protein
MIQELMLGIIDPFTLSLIASGVSLGVQGLQQRSAAKRADAQELEARQNDERVMASNKFQSDSLFLKSYPTAGIEQTTFAKYGGWVSRIKKMGKGGMIKRADGSYSQKGLWDNIRENKGSGKKPTDEMLKQEKKIKAKSMAMGGTGLPDYIAEGEEVVDFGPGNVPQAGKFGTLSRLSSNTAKINGDSHDDPSGGVEMTGGDRVFSDRLPLPSGFISKLRKL